MRISDWSSDVCSSDLTGLAETIAALRTRGLALGVATNDSEDSAWGSLAPFGVLDHFSYIVGFDSGHGAKPGPGMVDGFCKASGLAPAAIGRAACRGRVCPYV